MLQEEDDNFCYIALELCQATVHEYVEDWRFDRGQIDDLTILQQATNGLVYLHELGIGMKTSAEFMINL